MMVSHLLEVGHATVPTVPRYISRFQSPSRYLGQHFPKIFVLRFPFGFVDNPIIDGQVPPIDVTVIQRD